MTLAQYAKKLGVSKERVRYLVLQGRVKVEKVESPNGRGYYLKVVEGKDGKPL